MYVHKKIITFLLFFLLNSEKNGKEIKKCMFVINFVVFGFNFLLLVGNLILETTLGKKEKPSLCVDCLDRKSFEKLNLLHCF